MIVMSPEQLQQVIWDVVQAWDDAGTHPMYHIGSKNAVRRGWPRLGDALDNLSQAKGYLLIMPPQERRPGL